jgi:hypothetical protein
MHWTGRIRALGAHAFRQAGLEQDWHKHQRRSLADKPNSDDRAEGTTRACHGESNLTPCTNTVNCIESDGSP